jgi:pyruvyl transferase EpsO
MQSLRRLGVAVRHASDRHRIRMAAIAALPADVPILMHGGGNLGDLWLAYQEFREHIVGIFPQRRIIQLPQSIHFSSRAREEVAAERLRRHPDLTVLVRDAESLTIARDRMGLRARLCPDAAFGIDPSTLPAAPRSRHHTFRLWRTDKEAREAAGAPEAAGPTPPGDPTADWQRHERDLTRTVMLRLAGTLNQRGGARPASSRVAAALYHGVAERELRRGIRMLDQGHLVVTDRLHAVILALLSGHPVVWSDNSYRKIERVLGTWLPDAQQCTQTGNRAAAAQFAVTAGAR